MNCGRNLREICTGAGFQRAEEELVKQGRSLGESVATILDSPASRIYACFTKLGQMKDWDEELVPVMVSLAFGWHDEKMLEYIEEIQGLKYSGLSGSC